MMGRLALVALGLLTSVVCVARPMVVHQAHILSPPPGSGYYSFGHEVAIDGDWALIAASTPSATPTSPQQTHDALLYRRVNGQWVLDRILERRVSTVYGQYVGFDSMAMNNGVAVIGAAPTRVYRFANNNWTEIPSPFNAPPGDPDFVAGELEWDGYTLLAARRICEWYSQELWGARIARLNADGSWSPLERLSGPDTNCFQEPYHWGISGNTVVAGTYTNDPEEVPDQLHIFRRSGTAWVPTSAINGGNAEGDVRGNEIFFSADAPDGTRVYRNDDTQTVIDKIRSVNTSSDGAGRNHGFAHTSELFLQNSALYQKNDAGRYEYVANLFPTGWHTLVSPLKIDGRRIIAPAWRGGTSANQHVMIFDLPATFTPSPVIASGFQNGTTPFSPQSGTFAVVNKSGGNRVYRQTDLTGQHLAILGNSNWTEQSIEADIRPTAFSGSDRWFGLAVRYQDAANYYYVTLRSSGVVHLKRMLNGVHSTLAQWPLPIVTGRNYHVSLQISGTHIMVRIDGKKFTWSDDTNIPRGSAAILGYRAAAEYDNVVAAQFGQMSIFDLFHSQCYGPLENMRVWSGNGTGTWNCTGSSGVNTMRQTSTAGIARALVGTPTDDQIVTSRARMTGVNGQDRWFGIAARYVDESNYYYLTLRTSNTVSLRKLVNGAVTVLGTVNLPVTGNRWYDLRLDAVGNELRAFVNGAQVLQATDSSHATGQGGILMYKTAAEYTNYLAWQP